MSYCRPPNNRQTARKSEGSGLAIHNISDVIFLSKLLFQYKKFLYRYILVSFFIFIFLFFFCVPWVVKIIPGINSLVEGLVVVLARIFLLTYDDGTDSHKENPQKSFL